ncbi:MAG TPA: phospho-sugar mutase [Chlamydiales bacterium]|nr:phospho-sugar mutase [Chlamydiales bacterium]
MNFWERALDPDVQKRVQAWLDGPFDAETKAEIHRLISENSKELSNAFFKDLSFGTGGMRGIMGIGTNRMNIYTIRIATQGLANYLNEQPQPENGYTVFIGYDVREHSRLFAEETARVLAGNAIQAFISKEICPTPLVSFACRYLACSSAIVITASHNPPQYNGYKVYWSDGGQVVPPHDTGIMNEAHKVETIHLAPLDSPLIQWVGREIDEAYLKELRPLKLLPKINGEALHIVYSNLHGTGIRIIPEALKQQGYGQIALVEPQLPLDGKFTNAPSPNPEEEKALEIGMRQLMDTGADLLLATDPDADRIGVVVRDGNNAVRLTGNQTACICLEHICSCLKMKGEFPENAGFIKTIVTTELFKRIAEDFGGTCIDVLTGFKYIAEMIRLWENSFDGLQYIFGAEESYGCLFGTFVRDKDAISACCLVAEAAAFAKTNHQTLVEKLYEIYRKYGMHRESLTSLTFTDSSAGLKKIETLMQKLRFHPPSSLGNLEIVKMEDYLNGSMPLPQSDVLRFWLSDGSKLVIRPSGTEPKIKIYAEVMGECGEDMQDSIRFYDERLKQLVDHFQQEI